MADSDALYLVDGSGFIFRAYHALPPLTTKSGLSTGAVYGFTQMLIKLETDHRPSHLAVVFDAGSSSFRNELFSEYKANRTEPPDDLKPQFGARAQGGRDLQHPRARGHRLRGRRSHRDPGAAGARARAARRRRVVGQGPHAARRRRQGRAARHHEERAARLHLRREGGRGEVRRAARAASATCSRSWATRSTTSPASRASGRRRRRRSSRPMATSRT